MSDSKRQLATAAVVVGFVLWATSQGAARDQHLGAGPLDRYEVASWTPSRGVDIPRHDAADRDAWVYQTPGDEYSLQLDTAVRDDTAPEGEPEPNSDALAPKFNAANPRGHEGTPEARSAGPSALVD